LGDPRKVPRLPSTPASRNSWEYCSSATTRENLATRSSTYADERSISCSTVKACCARPPAVRPMMVSPTAAVVKCVGILLSGIR
jgi:hypothetical protein